MMDVSPLQRAIGFCQRGGPVATPTARDLCMICSNTNLLPVVSASGTQEQVVELTRSRLQSDR